MGECGITDHRSSRTLKAKLRSNSGRNGRSERDTYGEGEDREVSDATRTLSAIRLQLMYVVVFGHGISAFCLCPERLSEAELKDDALIH